MPTAKKHKNPGSTPGAAAGRVIRRLREATGVAQEAMAVEIGLHRTYMGVLERGFGKPVTSDARSRSQPLRFELAGVRPPARPRVAQIALIRSYPGAI
jgi:DNA-binding XRE family transcriptional regulator